MKDGLYHKSIGFPEGVVIKPMFGLKHSGHVKMREMEWNVSAPKHFLPRVSNVFEIEIRCGKLLKIVARASLGNGTDICYPILV